MKLFRFGEKSYEKPGVIGDDGVMRDASAAVSEYGNGQLRRSIEVLRAADIHSLPEITDGQRIASCVPRPGKIVCIGLNCALHAKEAGMEVPKCKCPNASAQVRSAQGTCRVHEGRKHNIRTERPDASHGFVDAAVGEWATVSERAHQHNGF